VQIYLASTSPRRQYLLHNFGIRFHVLDPNYDEPIIRGTDPRSYAIASAKAKALSVTGKVKKGLIIGVDTVVAVKRRILGKPGTRTEAEKMLKLLSGRTHSVVSGIALVRMPEKQVLISSETTLIAFHRLSDREIEHYLAAPEPYDKAGAYGIQGNAYRFVREVNGSYLNVVGLPICRLLSLLQQAKASPLLQTD